MLCERLPRHLKSLVFKLTFNLQLCFLITASLAEIGRIYAEF